MLYYPESCPRGLTDCEPIAQLRSDEEPITFYCVGRNDGTTRQVEQDCFRHCHKSAEGVDRLENCDRRDLTDDLSVIAQALSMLENEAADEL